MSQPFQFFVVLDFEATCDEGGAPQPQEIIEFPSVLMGHDGLAVLDAFERFVRPIHHPTLSPYCAELTGIPQSCVTAAETFPTVWREHQEWLRSHGLKVSAADTGAPFAFIVCGDWDLRTMLPGQLAACEPPIDHVPAAFRSWINIKRHFAPARGETKAPGMAGMLRELDLTLEGRHHRGIDDCRNIARIAQNLVANGATLNITSHLPVSRYPAIRLKLRHEDDAREITLERRERDSLLGRAKNVFRQNFTSIEFPDGRPLKRESEMLDLRSGQELHVK